MALISVIVLDRPQSRNLATLGLMPAWHSAYMNACGWSNTDQFPCHLLSQTIAHEPQAVMSCYILASHYLHNDALTKDSMQVQRYCCSRDNFAIAHALGSDW